MSSETSFPVFIFLQNVFNAPFQSLWCKFHVHTSFRSWDMNTLFLWISTIILSMFMHGDTLSMGNLEDKNSSIFAYNSGLEQDMKLKLHHYHFLSLKITPVYLSCAFYMISIFSWKSLPGVPAGCWGSTGSKSYLWFSKFYQFLQVSEVLACIS